MNDNKQQELLDRIRGLQKKANDYLKPDSNQDDDLIDDDDEEYEEEEDLIEETKNTKLLKSIYYLQIKIREILTIENLDSILKDNLQASKYLKDSIELIYDYLVDSKLIDKKAANIDSNALKLLQKDLIRKEELISTYETNLANLKKRFENLQDSTKNDSVNDSENFSKIKELEAKNSSLNKKYDKLSLQNQKLKVKMKSSKIEVNELRKLVKILNDTFELNSKKAIAKKEENDKKVITVNAFSKKEKSKTVNKKSANSKKAEENKAKASAATKAKIPVKKAASKATNSKKTVESTKTRKTSPLNK